MIVIGLSLGWHANSAALNSAWWNSWANGWSPQIAQPDFTLAGGLALALLFGKSMVGPLFAQTAWTNVTFIGSEIREPGKNLVRALVVGCGIVVILYLLANLAYVAVLPFSEIEHAPHNRVAVAMMNTIFGRTGAMCMAAAIMISTFGCNNGLILAGARVYYAMAEDGILPQIFKKVNPKTQVQEFGMSFFVAAIIVVLFFVAKFSDMLKYVMFFDTIGLSLVAMSIFILRKRTKHLDGMGIYTIKWFPFVPVIFILTYWFVTANIFINFEANADKNPWSLVICLGA